MQLRIVTLREPRLHLVTIVTVQPLISANPQVATTVCQQTRHGIAAQAVAYTQCLEYILCYCHLCDKEHQKDE